MGENSFSTWSKYLGKGNVYVSKLTLWRYISHRINGIFKDFFHMNAKLDLKPHYYEGIGHIPSV